MNFANSLLMCRSQFSNCQEFYTETVKQCDRQAVDQYFAFTLLQKYMYSCTHVFYGDSIYHV